MTQLLRQPAAGEPVLPPTDDTAPPVLGLIRRLLERLGEHTIRYVHWKSNRQLVASLAGEGDLDLLVDRAEIARFEEILAGLDFKRANDHLRAHLPSVLHFYGMDDDTGALVHLHVYYRLLTGETVLKNYHFPVEQLLLDNPRVVHGVRLPQASAELLLFVLRAMLKYSSLAECMLLRQNEVREELEDLLRQSTVDEANALLTEWLPTVEPRLFEECVQALRTAGRWRRYRLARRLRRSLRGYRRFSFLHERLLRLRLFLKAFWGRLRGKRGKKTLASGGALIAFIGPDATGKSTMVEESARWLGRVFRVRTGHLGRPRSTCLTWLPNLAKSLVRLVRSGENDQTSDAAFQAPKRRPGLLYRWRAVFLALERRALAMRLHRRAANGDIVICDRYPSAIVGAMDGARLDPADGGLLARWENRIYRQIPAPDLLIQLTLPVDVALERNRQRQADGKSESDAYLRHRHTNPLLPSFANTPQLELDTSRPRAETIDTARRILWRIL